MWKCLPPLGLFRLMASSFWWPTLISSQNSFLKLFVCLLYIFMPSCLISNMPQWIHIPSNHMLGFHTQLNGFSFKTLLNPLDWFSGFCWICWNPFWRTSTGEHERSFIGKHGNQLILYWDDKELYDESQASRYSLQVRWKVKFLVAVVFNFESFFENLKCPFF